uniref:Uncharacterized protein n=1 Tax=Arundo donax TaxID=35708 RepID=A0A0A9DP03_ARUDO
MPCNGFLIMYNTMVMRREQSAQQPRTMFRGVNASLDGTTPRWLSNLFAIVVQHSSTIKYEEPSFPVTSQV